MEKINKPEGLPECKIINELIIKANTKTDYEFNYINQLDEFRKIVSIEVSRINQLFPEYTPHDEQYHLKRLFYVADQMLDDEIIENMNATELFLLSISLYGHDWGMAMSEEEKEYILNGCKTDNTTVNLLDDEENRIKEFCRNKNIELDKIELEDWREYVRLTHAFRSGKRVKKHFEPISSGVAEFASRVCEGHGLDFGIIDDHISYPTDASIHREIVNVKALTIYVRLIDLLDLGEDRTPYVLWKFVAPRNNFSKMEWEKHRALQAVTFPNYQSVRSIQVDGSTDNQNVYMSIMDLKRYVDEQFRQCSDILNRINHNYHKLNISHIDWRIAARGFDPVAIQFEFDRNSMFNILGDEIYQGNPYIFIRELLQNAIDAIEMRTEILEKQNISFKPKIKIQITEDDIHYIVQITDNGIGMDEYIIRNYLTIAGKSYYRSIDFQKEGLKMDPISRFGIGILSCFMTADYVEIETFKDPHTTQPQEPLRISIPSKENYFKIKKNAGSLDIGTTFKVFVIKNKLPKNKKTGNRIEFNITEYLKKTAGFVKYPISITEKGIETMIVNPNDSKNENSSVYKIDYRFPIEKVFLPQDKEVVEEYFEEKIINLKSDLHLTNYDGCLVFLLPKSESIDIVFDYSGPEANVIDYKTVINTNKRIRWNREWNDFVVFSDSEDEIEIPERNYNVFIDGILIQEISPPNIELSLSKDEDNNLPKYYKRDYSLDSFICPQLIVNIPKPDGMKIDLARTNIKTAEKWDKPIWLAFFDYLKNNIVKNILHKNPKEKLFELAKLITFYKLTDEIVIEYFLSNSKFPLPFVSNQGSLIFIEHDTSTHALLRTLPDEYIVKAGLYDLLNSSYTKQRQYNSVFTLWRGSDVIATNGYVNSRIPHTIKNIYNLTKSFLNRNYYFDSIEFITSPRGARFPLIQKIYKLRPNGIPIELKESEIQEINLDLIDNYSIRKLNDLLTDKFGYHFPILIKFPAPYESKMFYKYNYINLNNPIIKSFVNVCISVIRAEENLISKENVGKLFDMIKDCYFISDNDYSCDIRELNNQINTIMDEAVKINIIKDSCLKLEININDFIENTITFNNKTKKFYQIRVDSFLDGAEEWGEILS